MWAPFLPVFGVMQSLLVAVRDCAWLGGTKKGVQVVRAVPTGGVVLVDRPFVSSEEPNQVKSALMETMEAFMYRNHMEFLFDNLHGYDSVDLHDLVDDADYDHVVNELAVCSPELGQTVFKRIMATHMPMAEGTVPSPAARLLLPAACRDTPRALRPAPQAASVCSRCSALRTTAACLTRV